MVTLLSSAVIAAIVSGTIAIITNIRNSKLKYITEERQKWRENIRNIVPKIMSTNSCEEKKNLLEQLRLGLNPQDTEDQIIIEIIDDSLKEYPYEISTNNNIKFRNLIQNLLKYEWEKAKYEAGLSFSFYEFLLSATFLLLIYNLFHTESWVLYSLKPLYIFFIAFIILVVDRRQKFYKNHEKEKNKRELLYFIFKKPFRVKFKDIDNNEDDTITSSI